MKKCKECKAEKSLEDFRQNKVNGKLYYRGRCKKCETKVNYEYTLKRKEKDRKKYLKDKKESYQRNAQTYAKYREDNKEYRREQNKEWKLKNRAHCTHKENMRRAKKLKATPNWLTEQHIEEIKNKYKESKELTTKETTYTVDHIIPLQGETVSGLHVPWNLQILTLEENSSKKNKI